MEFEELKKVWDEQNQKTIYTIDEQTLHNIITKKKRGAIKKARLMEYVLIGANLLAGSFVIGAHILKEKGDYFGLSMGIIMVLTAVVCFYFRSQRISGKNRFNNTINGDINHAISDALYVVRTSRTMQFYFILIVILTLLSIGFDDVTFTIGIAAFFAFVFYASTWEHKWYVNKLRELERLKSVLESEES